ncbi:FAD-dependent oxidoreductase [Corynebacterium hindlerae]|uniref:FAD-dependent oxidoreductase n=1 Tax=Corynebacterium hindlerae TaxID=699041 RepID=UPI003AAC97D4
MERCDVLIIGAGQAGLATAYYLRRSGLHTVLVDATHFPGGSWNHTWDSLRLFSPARISSLPGWRLDLPPDSYPSPEQIVAYFTAYELRYGFDVRRPVTALRTSGTGPFTTRLSTGKSIKSHFVVNATGNASRPFVPSVPGQRLFLGRQLHSRNYRTATDFKGQRVAVVGGGNSGAQIAADLLGQAHVTWCTLHPPRFLPDDYDGAKLFSVASRYISSVEKEPPKISDLGDIVMVPAVKEARDQGKLQATEMFARLTSSSAVWADGHETKLDAVIWCTGFRPALRHLRGYRLELNGTAVVGAPGMHVVGYGDWVGPAADTILGVSPYARAAAKDIMEQA